MIGARGAPGGAVDEAIGQSAEGVTADDTKIGLSAVDALAVRFEDRAFLGDILVVAPAPGPGGATPTPTPVPTPTPTASPTATPMVTPTPSGPLQTWSHTGTVESVAFSQDGTFVVSGSAEGTVIVHDLVQDLDTKGYTLPGDLKFVAVSPDGTRLAVAAGAKAYLIPIAGGSPSELAAHGQAITSLAFSPDGKTVLTSSTDKISALWNALATSSVPVSSHTHASGVTAAAFRPDGQSFFESTDDHQLIWRTIGGIASQSAPTSFNVRSIAVSSDGAKVAMSLGEQGVAGVRETRDLGISAFLNLFGNFIVPALAFMPDSERIISAYTTSARLWPYRGERAGETRREWHHDAPVRSLAISTDGSWLVTGTTDGKVRLWAIGP